MASTAAKVVLGIGCGFVLLVGAGLATCAGCAAMIGHSNLRPASPSASSSASEAQYPTWKGGESERSQMDGSRTVQYRLRSDDILEGWLSVEKPVIVAECRERKIEAYLVTGMPLNPELGRFQKYTVRLRFDNNVPTSETWSASTDDKAVFAPRPVVLLKRIAQAKILRVEVTPFNSNPGVATFHVEGFSEPLAKITGACRSRH
jgi:hypothetical protein